MSLDGLRAWIGEVERKLGMRTRVFLVLATIAIGGAGAAIYLAIDTREDAVSETDVQELQEQLEAGGVAGGADATQLQAEVDALEAEVDRLSGKGGAADGGSTAPGEDSGGTGGASTEAGEGSKARAKELLEQAQKQSEEGEAAEEAK